MADHSRRKGVGKRMVVGSGESSTSEVLSAAPLLSSSTPCGACKFLRRKCITGCVFAPHFASDQGPAKFAAVHKVFGASNISKLLLSIPFHRRHDAVVTIIYEAQARLSDPVYGCVATVLSLQQQVASLQAELAVIQSQLVKSRLAIANALQSNRNHRDGRFGHLRDGHHHHHGYGTDILPPAYSNNSSGSTNQLLDIGNFSPGFEVAAETSQAGRGR